MNTLLKRLNYKGQKRIAIINPQNNTITDAFSEIPDITIDGEIDLRYPYDFMILYAKKAADASSFPGSPSQSLRRRSIMVLLPQKEIKKDKQ